ncbi:extracellular solute-binding protein [Campylobacter novaezeelandiae]|uniref:Extracellular solute-binding protein n=1 Tax=Campylobacter novaezeelandiae TaxID=2267891 RepID=A0A4Q9JWY4_9BACT|nr:extracellular solute-binding protein [Campylobacter novaezeelandiae]QWU80674.1 major antigenic peptide PEB3 [Campylobacter novaezeelandiae]TBR78471.1 extracellular solute-binding protein [Campylobacter novaezeelandiae]TBR80383.1 extracellular solute-binding protein [Campylobacter novaezeelandiae]TBR81789.1 extracellular solute-binding protein [Campylobacter novaezeelandiae]
MKKIISLFGAIALALSVANADINLYGPGGPHTALKDVGTKYTEKTGVKVNVNFGPQATWFEKAKNDADILFGASDQSALAIASDFGEEFNIKNIKPLYFREAIILTQKGNPLNIKGLKDLAKKEVRIVVPEGAGKSNTSGTGVWEDMIGRTKNIKMIQDFRKNIVAFVPNSGSAKKLFAENKADAWITWLDWSKSNPDIGTAVQIEKDLVIYRTFNVVARENSNQEVKDFINFLSSKEAKEIFKKYGWRE